MVKGPVRRLAVGILHTFLESASLETRKKFGEFLANNNQSVLGKRFLSLFYQARPVDAYLISFPKSGRTWLRLMLGRVFECHYQLSDPNLMEHKIRLEPLAKLNPLVPKIRVQHDDNPHWKKPGELKHSKNQYRNSKVIFLARDPRDIVVSAYFEAKKRVDLWVDTIKKKEPMLSEERFTRFEGTLSEFIQRDVGSLDSLIAYYNIWSMNRHIPRDYLLIRYEDLIENPHRELRRVMDFLGMPFVSNEIIDNSIQYTSFENMHRMEKERAFDSDILRPANESDPDSFKTRKGKVGGYLEHMNVEDIAYINNKLRNELSEIYNYRPELTEQAIGEFNHPSTI